VNESLTTLSQLLTAGYSMASTECSGEKFPFLMDHLLQREMTTRLR